MELEVRAAEVDKSLEAGAAGAAGVVERQCGRRRFSRGMVELYRQSWTSGGTGERFGKGGVSGAERERAWRREFGVWGGGSSRGQQSTRAEPLAEAE